MALYSALRDGFNDINKTIRDHAEWQERHALAKEDRAMKRMQMEQDFQDQALRRQTLKLQAAEAVDRMTPKVLSLEGFDPESSAYDNPEFQKKASAITGGKFDRSTLTFTGEDGEPIKMNSIQGSDAMLALDTLKESYENTPAAMAATALELDDGIAAARAKLKTAPVGKKAGIAQQISEMQTRKDAADKWMSDGNLLRYWKEQADESTRKAAYFARNGRGDVATIMNKNASDARENVKVILSRLNKEKSGGKGTGTYSNQKVYNVSNAPQVYVTRSGKTRTVQPGGWVDSFSLNPKLEGNIMHVASQKVHAWDDGWMGFDPQQALKREPQGPAPKVTTFDQGYDNIAKSRFITSKTGAIANPEVQPEVETTQALYGAISSKPEYIKKHGTDHKPAQVQAQKVIKQMNNNWFKAVSRAKNAKTRDAIVAMIIELDPEFTPEFGKNGKLKGNKLKYQKLYKEKLKEAFDRRIEQLIGEPGLSYTPSAMQKRLRRGN